MTTNREWYDFPVYRSELDNHLHTTPRDAAQGLPALPASQRREYVYKPVGDDEPLEW